MKTLQNFIAGILCIMVSLSSLAQSTQKPNEQEGIVTRVTVLEKGQLVSKARLSDIKKQVGEQKSVTDSITLTMRQLEIFIQQREDSLKAKTESIDRIKEELTSVKRRLTHHRQYAYVGIFLAIIWSLVIAGIMLILYRKIKGLASRTEDLSTHFEQNLMVLRDQMTSCLEKLDSVQANVYEHAESHRRDFQSMESRLSSIGNEIRAEVDLKQNAMQMKLSGDLDQWGGKLGGELSEHKQKTGTLIQKIEAFEARLKDMKKED